MSCAISDKKSTQAKKEWMKGCFADGYQFWKADARGKALIEFVPAENAWASIAADGYLFIDCFGSPVRSRKKDMVLRCWSGAVKRQRNWGKKGLAAVCADKNGPSSPILGFIKARVLDGGYRAAFFKLLYLPFDGNAISQDSVKASKEGLLHSRALWSIIRTIARGPQKVYPISGKRLPGNEAPRLLSKIGSKEEAQEAPSPFPTFSVYYNGTFVTNEIFSGKKVHRFLEGKGF